MFYIKKEFTKSSLALYLSLILVIGSLLQISSTDFFENNDHILIKIPSIYAQEGDNGDDKIMTSAAFDIDNNNTLTSIHKPILYLLLPDFPGVECGLPGAFCENG
ncbi:MAG TPA: hypothetical protein VFP49_06940 [Nitrososphaeraceae archaeon]|nr:hypothetical protein [Nitrososphaeraceae archaeon]